MDNNKIKELKKERLTIRIIGILLMIAGYAIMGICMQSDSPFGIFGLFGAFFGIILVLRSFIHYKYHVIKQAEKENKNISE